MKTLPGFTLVLLCLLLMACNQQPAVVDQMRPQYTACYQAIDGSDTALLSIDTSNKRILGTFEMKYGKDKVYAGQIKGLIKGDTLIGHYDFKLNKVDKWYRNPVAFLKKEGKLIMGVGEISMVWGSPFFDTNTPIDYDKGRFVFSELACLEK